MSGELVYSHTFKCGTTAVAKFVLPGLKFTVEWGGKRTKEMLPEYREWMSAVSQDVEAKTGKRIAHVIVT